jgi:LPXTG-motif cell wall-anchored protein
VTTFKVEGLPKYQDGKELHYYVIETQVNGYKAPSYATSEGNSLVFTGSDVPKATNGQQIINTPVEGYELPSTGGPGTRLFTILGSILILGAGVLVWRRRRLI